MLTPSLVALDLIVSEIHVFIRTERRTFYMAPPSEVIGSQFFFDALLILLPTLNYVVYF